MRVTCPTHLNLYAYYRKTRIKKLFIKQTSSAPASSSVLQISAATFSRAPSSRIQAFCYMTLCWLENNSERFGEAWCLRNARYQSTLRNIPGGLKLHHHHSQTTSLVFTLLFSKNVNSKVFDTPEICLSPIFTPFRFSFPSLLPSVNGGLLCLIYLSRFSWFDGFVQECVCVPAHVFHLTMLSAV
jgi:hypothetical protein